MLLFVARAVWVFSATGGLTGAVVALLTTPAEPERSAPAPDHVGARPSSCGGGQQSLLRPPPGAAAARLPCAGRRTRGRRGSPSSPPARRGSSPSFSSGRPDIATASRQLPNRVIKYDAPFGGTR